jgi:hypothetical protein
LGVYNVEGQNTQIQFLCTDRHDTTEILLKVALNNINRDLNQPSTIMARTSYSSSSKYRIDSKGREGQNTQIQFLFLHINIVIK